MDKVSIALCYEPSLYAKRYAEGRMFELELMVSDYFTEQNIPNSSFDMLMYANAMRTFVECEMMGQKGKFLDFVSSDKVYDTFVWDYYYPYQNMRDKFLCGNQVIVFYTLAEPRRMEQLISRLTPMMQEHSYVSCSKDRLIKIYVGDSIRNIAHIKEYGYDLCIHMNSAEYPYEWLKKYVYDILDPYFKELIRVKKRKHDKTAYLQIKGK